MFNAKKRPGKYIKLHNGESITGFFVGDPVETWEHWTGERSETCKKGDCEWCNLSEEDPSYKRSFKFTVNFLVKQGQTLNPKLFKHGPKVYRDLTELGSKVDLSKNAVKISRVGEEELTRYFFESIGVQLSEEELEAIQKVPLIEIKPD